MLATKKSARVTPEVNLWNPFKGSSLSLEPKTDDTRSPNKGISGPTKLTEVVYMFSFSKRTSVRIARVTCELVVTVSDVEINGSEYDGTITGFCVFI